MITHREMKQGSAEWLALHSGRMTGSIASKLMTPTGRPSTQYRQEIARIIAERKGWQAPKQFDGTEWTMRGLDMESEARLWFSIETGLSVEQVGFVESDDHLVGFSPDGLVTITTDTPDWITEIVAPGDQVPLELKVPMPSTHIRWLLDNELPGDHIAQVHFAMAVSGAPACFFMSYNEDVRPLLLLEKRNNLTQTMEMVIDTYKEEFTKSYTLITGEIP